MTRDEAVAEAARRNRELADAPFFSRDHDDCWTADREPGRWVVTKRRVTRTWRQRLVDALAEFIGFT
jgi:hypothetical protein